MSAEYHFVRLEGDLLVHRYPEFRKAFEALPPVVPVLVDLTSAENVDSTFLTEMLVAKRKHGAPFSVLVRSSGNVAKVFEITGLGSKMNVYHDLSEAIDSLGVTGRSGEEGSARGFEHAFDERGERAPSE